MQIFVVLASCLTLCYALSTSQQLEPLLSAINALYNNRPSVGAEEQLKPLLQARADLFEKLIATRSDAEMIAAFAASSSLGPSLRAWAAQIIGEDSRNILEERKLPARGGALLYLGFPFNRNRRC